MSRDGAAWHELGATLRARQGFGIAAVTTVAVLLLQVWLLNLSMIWTVITSADMSAGETVAFLWASLGAIRTTFSTAGAALAVAVSVLFGLHVAVTVRYVRQRAATSSSGTLGIAGLVVALAGAGCSACGAVLLSFVLGGAATATVVGALPLHGLEFGLLAAATLVGALAFTVRRLAQPPACETPATPTGDARRPSGSGQMTPSIGGLAPRSSPEGERGHVPTLRNVETVHLEPAGSYPQSTAGDWPCPVCGRREPTANSYNARVRNRTGPPLERWVRVCADCVASLPRARTASSDGRAESGQEARRPPP